MNGWKYLKFDHKKCIILNEEGVANRKQRSPRRQYGDPMITRLSITGETFIRKHRDKSLVFFAAIQVQDYLRKELTMFGLIILFVLVMFFVGRLFSRPFYGYYRPRIYPYGGFGNWGMGRSYGPIMHHGPHGHMGHGPMGHGRRW